MPNIFKSTAGTSDFGWTSFTPTGSWTSNVTYSGQYRRVGDTMECWVKIVLSGAPDNISLTLTLPNSLTMDTTKLPLTTASVSTWLGNGTAWDNGTNQYYLNVAYNSSTSVVVQAMAKSGTYVGDFTSLSQTVPHTWASTDQVNVKFSLPISGWS